MPYSKKEKNALSGSSERIQVVDRQNRPLAALSQAQVFRQKLLHQSVHALVHTSSQHIFLHQSSSQKQETTWDITGSSLVFSEESPHDTAERICRPYFKNGLDFPYTVCSVLDEEHRQFLTLYRLYPDQKDLQNITGISLDKIEIARLIQDLSSILGPYLIKFWQMNLLFPPDKTKS